MNDKLRFKLMKADEEFVKKIRKVIPNRIRNYPNENVRELTDRELTRMMKNTMGFEESLKELETLPRRKINEWP